MISDCEHSLFSLIDFSPTLKKGIRSASCYVSSVNINSVGWLRKRRPLHGGNQSGHLYFGSNTELAKFTPRYTSLFRSDTRFDTIIYQGVGKPPHREYQQKHNSRVQLLPYFSPILLFWPCCFAPSILQRKRNTLSCLYHSKPINYTFLLQLRRPFRS